MKVIDVLGTAYTVTIQADEDNKKLNDCDGYVDFSGKNIYISNLANTDMENKLSAVKDTIRHEIVHAFLYESGLNNSSYWARNEEMIDWIALQFEKMYTAMKTCEAVK